MQFIREEGYTAAGFSREITVIDCGETGYLRNVG